MNQMMIVGVLNRCLGAGASEKEVRCASEWLRSLMRRDWDVLVLDAACSAEGDMWETYRSSRQSWEVKVRLAGDEYWYPGAKSDAARHAAALAVFSTLDRNAPNWPGDEP